MAPFFSRHCHRTIIFYFSATATCATFSSSRQWHGGAKSGASAHAALLFILNVPCNKHRLLEMV